MRRHRLWFVAAFVVMGAFTAVQFVLWRRDEAEDRLQQFYAAMASERFADGRRLIDRAIELCPCDARYHAWKGYTGSFPPFPPQFWKSYVWHIAEPGGKFPRNSTGFALAGKSPGRA